MCKCVNELLLVSDLGIRTWVIVEALLLVEKITLAIKLPQNAYYGVLNT